MLDDATYEHIIKSADWGKLGRGALDVAKNVIGKPAQYARSAIQKVPGMSGVGANASKAYTDRVADTQKLWKGLHGQNSMVGSVSRGLTAANKIRKNKWVQGLGLGAIIAPEYVPGSSAIKWIANPVYSALDAGAAGMQGLRANTDHWQNKLESSAKAGSRLAGEEAMYMVGNGYTGDAYNNYINQQANQAGLGGTMSTLRQGQNYKAPGLASSIFNGDADGYIQGQIRQNIINRQRGF